MLVKRGKLNKGKWKTRLNLAVSWTWRRVPLPPARDPLQRALLRSMPGMIRLEQAVLACCMLWSVQCVIGQCTHRIQLHKLDCAWFSSKPTFLFTPLLYLYAKILQTTWAYAVSCIKLENLSCNFVLITRLHFLEESINSVLLNKYPFLSELCRIKRLKQFP